jgi:hypothetical protein
MHPDMLHALAHERQAELLRHNQFRHRRRPDTRFSDQGVSRPVPRLRHSLGALLVNAGTRLLGGTAAAMESRATGSAR